LQESALDFWIENYFIYIKFSEIPGSIDNDTIVIKTYRAKCTKLYVSICRYPIHDKNRVCMCVQVDYKQTFRCRKVAHQRLL